MPVTSELPTYVRNFPDRRPLAAGLYVTHQRKLYLFRDLGPGGRPDRFMTVSSSRNATIRVDGPDIERVHAMIERKPRNRYYLINRSPKIDTFADDGQVVRPVPLLVGMVVQLARVQMVATDEHGDVDLPTVSELCRTAYHLYGSYRRAGAHVGRSHNFVRKQFLPRDRRFKKAEEK